MVAWAFDGATGMQANKADRVTATIEERIRIGESSEYAASWDWLAREREHRARSSRFPDGNDKQEKQGREIEQQQIPCGNDKQEKQGREIEQPLIP
jgi:hypothetical protein